MGLGSSGMARRPQSSERRREEEAGTHFPVVLASRRWWRQIEFQGGESSSRATNRAPGQRIEFQGDKSSSRARESTSDRGNRAQVGWERR
jgi:hypothetical protein